MCKNGESQSSLMNLQYKSGTQDSGIIAEDGLENLWKPKEQEVCCEILCFTNVRSHTHEF